MKKLLTILLFLCSVGIMAQDVIVKKDGSTIVCRVEKVSETDVTYKLWSDLKGSSYVMDKSLVSAINYENGKKVNLSEATNFYKPNNQNDGVQQYNDRALLQLDAAANYSSTKSKTLKTIGWIGGPVLAAFGVVAQRLAETEASRKYNCDRLIDPRFDYLKKGKRILCITVDGRPGNYKTRD